MASIRDYAITINVAATASMVCEMPTHETGDVLLTFANKDAATAFTAPAGWEPLRVFAGTGEYTGAYTKRAASASETLTLTLAIDQCNAVVVAVKDAEAAIVSSAATVSVVAAGLTYTRGTGSWTTDGFSVGQTVIMSGFTNAGNNGAKEIVSITGAGLILTVTSVAALVNETGDGNELATSTGLDKTAGTAANDSTLPFGGASVTPIANNCLMLHALGGDLAPAPSAYPGWVNLFGGDNAASSICVSYTFNDTAGAVTGPNHWALTEDDTTAIIVAVRDSGSLTTVPAYIAPGTTPAVQVSPLVGVSGNVDKGTWELTTNDVTTLAGKTMGQVDIVSAVDSGYNPFRSAARVIAASSVTNLTASEMRFASAVDMTAQAGVIFGTFRPQVPRDYLDMAKPVNGGGGIVMFADAENDYKAWVVAAQFSKSTDPSNRGNYAIQVQGSSDTSYGTSGTIAWSAINDLYLAGGGYYGACSVEWSELYLLNETVLAGGSATNPMGFDEMVRTVNNGSGFLPLMVQSGVSATLWTRLRLGGVDAFHASVSLRTFQYPRKADEVDYLDFHVDNNHMGIEFYGLASDTFTFTNCVFTSDSPYYWRFNASHSSSANLDFSGSTVVNATVTLRSTSDLDSVTFINCPTFTQNSATLTNCSFSNTKVSSAEPADAALISDSSFTSAGTGHGIEIGGTAANITLDGLTFTGYSGTSTNAAIYVNIATGSMTISISGGGSTPSIRTAGATVTVQNAVTVKVTAKDADDSTAVQSARVLLYASTGTTVTITRSGSTASVAHTAHGYANSQKVLISGAVQGEYNGIKTISNVSADAYDYTVSGTPATPATGTITSYRVILDADTNASGIVQDTAFSYVSDLAVVGKVRKGSASPLYKNSPLSGTITSAGLDLTTFLVSDE